MAAPFEYRADLKLATQTQAAIDAATLRGAEDGWRGHLGASQIGNPCDRALWYGFRFATRAKHPPRLLRLFARGHREEDNLAGLLRDAGIQVYQVDAATGKQWSFASVGGHFAGSMDGACVGLPEAPQTYHVLEFKTAGDKAWKDLSAKGVHFSKPEHWSQMQCYMAWTGMERALYMSVNKNTDELHIERIDADPKAQQGLMERAARIIAAPVPPERMSQDQTFYLCRFCDHHAVCHLEAAPAPTCRSCSHSTPELDGQARWSCARHSGKTLTMGEQKAGCQAHRYIPATLATWADAIDANDQNNWVSYRHKGTGQTFTNGAQPGGFSSLEIQAATDKAALGAIAADSYTQALRETFDAEVVA